MRDRTPKAKILPQSAREVRARENPDNTDKQTPAWQFCQIDHDHREWGFRQLTPEQFFDLICVRLKNLESMKWADIRAQAGGRGRNGGTNHHQCPLDGFSSAAQRRLRDLGLDDIDGLFSLRLTQTLRLYGVKDGRVIRFIWYDPHHGSPNGSYPVRG